MDISLDYTDFLHMAICSFEEDAGYKPLASKKLQKVKSLLARDYSDFTDQNHDGLVLYSCRCERALPNKQHYHHRLAGADLLSAQEAFLLCPALACRAFGKIILSIVMLSFPLIMLMAH